jgi:hypothetical protein
MPPLNEILDKKTGILITREMIDTLLYELFLSDKLDIYRTIDSVLSPKSTISINKAAIA